MSVSEHDPDHRSGRLLAGVFGDVAEALLEDDVDLIDVLDQLLMACVSIIGVGAAAVVIDDQRGHLIPVASTSEETGLLELFQVRMNQGPCLDAIRGGSEVSSPDLSADHERWPAFVDAAHIVGFRSVLALPMRCDGQTIGGLNLFGSSTEPMSDEHRRLAHALAHLATLAIVYQRSARRSAVLADQLQGALNSRVTIEQAKGVLAERHNISMQAAFDKLRRYARDHNRKLGEVAGAVVRGELTPP